MSPALAGGFLTTAPPGKPLYSYFECPLYDSLGTLSKSHNLSVPQFPHLKYEDRNSTSFIGSCEDQRVYICKVFYIYNGFNNPVQMWAETSFPGFSYERWGSLGLGKSLLNTRGQTEANICGEQNIEN